MAYEKSLHGGSQHIMTNFNVSIIFRESFNYISKFHLQQNSIDQNMEGAKVHENEAEAQAFEYIFGFGKLAAVRCAVELEIPDILEQHAASDQGIITLAYLSQKLKCSPSVLQRIMRVLTHHQIFQEIKIDNATESLTAYMQTGFSRLLMRNKLGPLLLLFSNPAILTSNLSLSNLFMSKNGDLTPFEVSNGADFWKYTNQNPSFSDLLKEGLGSMARFTISTLIQNHWSVFQGITSLVDVGGGNGAALCALVKVCPWITRAINFDLPHVVASLKSNDCVEHVGGDMFQSVPSADAVLIMLTLHDWDDEACVKILKNCKQAIPKGAGKLIILDIVIDENSEDNKKYRNIHLALDMTMMALTTGGKERTSEEWINIMNAAGFTKHTIKHIPHHQSLIEAYP